MNSILITGCNRGLGLGLVKQIVALAEPPKHIFATCRNIDQAQELRTIADQHSNVHILQLDLNDFDSYDNVVSQVDAIVQDKGLNVLFNNAGIASKSTRLGLAKADDLIDCFRINTVAPVMLTKAAIPLLKKSSLVNCIQPLGVSRAAIINMSSILGSIDANVEGGMYAYRMSKCGLNAATKSMSIDLKKDKILCVSLHPGWVKTEMGGSKAPLSIDSSCANMLKEILNLNECHNGGFIQYDGKPLKWRAAKLNAKNPMGVTKAAVINMSSEEGSIALNYGTGWFGYRISKAGLNSASKNMSMELESEAILCVSVHPGWVRTDMGGPCAPLDVETSCREVCKLMMKLNKSHNGYSTQYDGERLPW